MAVSIITVTKDTNSPPSEESGLKRTFAGPLRDVLSQLQQAQEDSERSAAAAQKSESFGCLWLCLIMAGVFLSVAGVNVASNGYILYGPGMFMFALGFWRLQQGRQNARGHRNLIMDRRKLQFAEQLLDLMSVDLDPDKSQTLDLDFRSLTSAPFCTRTDQVGAKVRTAHSQEWLRCKLALAGSLQLGLSLRRTQNQKVKHKRRSSPFRRKTVDLIAVTVRPGRDPGIQRILEMTPPPQQLKLHRSKATPEMVSAVLSTQPAEEIHTRTLRRDTSDRKATPHTVLSAIIYTFYALGRAPAVGPASTTQPVPSL